MAEEKRYFWLKFDKGFMDKRIKKLRKIAGGDTYTIIYLKMILASIETGGVIRYEGVEDTLAEEIALDLDEDPDNVQITVNFLETQGLLVDMGNGDYLLPYAEKRIGSESASAERVRRHRERQKALQCNTDVTEQLRACNVEKRREEKRREDEEIEREEIISQEVEPAPAAARERIDYQSIKDLYNSICVSFPECKLLSDKRKKEIKACINNGITQDQFKKAFEKAQNSSFMKGNNNRSWSANFDWMIKPNNIVKILDGNYDDKEKDSQQAQTSPSGYRGTETLDDFNRRAAEWAEQ